MLSRLTTRSFLALVLSTAILTVGIFPHLSLAQGTPAETLKRAQKEKLIEPDVIDTEKNRWVEVLPVPLTEKDIPAVLKPLYELEKINARYQEEAYFGEPINMRVLGPYDPLVSTLSYAPYIPMPKSAFSEYLIGSDLPEEMKKSLFFKTKDGVEYARFFIHPTKTSSYEELIEKYGIVRTEFVGFFGASPRSMYVWDPKHPERAPFVSKSSLHYTIDGSVRINIPQKAARSHVVTEVFASIPQSVKAEYNFDYLAEPVALLPRGKATATLYRALPPEFLKSRGKKVVPGFYFSSIDPDTGKTLLETLLKGSKYVAKDSAEILRPLLRVASYLMFQEGLLGELHEQNVYFELDAKNRPTGKIFIKDLDGFRVDTELRVLLGKSNAGLSDVFKPFVYSKFSKASGWGGENGGFSQEAYDVFIKHTFGYSFCKVLNCGSRKLRQQLYEQMNIVMAEEAAKITGMVINPHTLSTKDYEYSAGLSNLADRYRANLNEGVTYFNLAPEFRTGAYQRVLREQFLKLRKQKRASSVLGHLDASNTYFILRENLIEARTIDFETKSESPIGFASLYQEQNPQTENFRERVSKVVRENSGQAKSKPIKASDICFVNLKSI